MLSHPVPITALVGHYPTNKLIGRGLILGRNYTFGPKHYLVLPAVSRRYPRSEGKYPRVTLPFAARVLPKEPFRPTCMPNPRRQRSF